MKVTIVNKNSNPNTGLKRFAQATPVNQAFDIANSIATQSLGLGAVKNVFETVTQSVKPSKEGMPVPSVLEPGLAMSQMYSHLQSLYAIGAQYGMSQEEIKAYSDTLFHNGFLIPQQAELFEKLQDIIPQLGGNFRDVLTIVMRLAIQYRAASPAEKVNKILEVLKQLSQEYQRNPSFNIVNMFAQASRGNVEALPIMAWDGAFIEAMKHGTPINDYYTKINGLVADVYGVAHHRLAIENKKASIAELFAQNDFLREEAMQKLIWEKVHQPNFEALTKIYASWAKNPEEAFNILGANGLEFIQMLSKNIMLAGAKIGAFTMPFTLSKHSPELKPAASDNQRRVYAGAEVVAQTRQDIRKEETGKLQDYNEFSGAAEGAGDGASGASGGKGKNPYIKPGTTQERAQMDSFGATSNPFQAMVQLNATLAPLQQRLNELESNLSLMGNTENYKQGWMYRIIQGTIAPLQAAMVAESGMKVGGGTNEFSQMNSTTLLTPEMVGQTVVKADKLIEQTFAAIREYGSIISQFVNESRRLLNTKQHQNEITQLSFALKQFDSNSKLFQTDLEKFKYELVDYNTVLPTLINVTRLENQISLFENLSTQIKSTTGSDLIGQFGLTNYQTTTPDGKPTIMTGPAPGQALILLYMRVIVEFKKAINKIQSVLGTGKLDKSLTNALIQRRKQIVAKIAGIRTKYTQIIAGTLGSVAGGAPASLDKQVRLTARIVNERTSGADEQEADRIADEIIRKYFDDLLPGYGTILEHPDKHRHETVEEVEEHTRKHKHKSHKHESEDE